LIGTANVKLTEVGARWPIYNPRSDFHIHSQCSCKGTQGM